MSKFILNLGCVPFRRAWLGLILFGQASLVIKNDLQKKNILCKNKHLEKSNT